MLPPGPMRVVANGEIWTVEQARRCRAVTGCDAIMIGRGLVTDPGLGLAIRGQAGGVPWQDMLPLLHLFWQRVCRRVERRHRAGRLKQWLNYRRKSFPEAQAAFDELRASNDPAHIEAWLALHAPQPHRLPGECRDAACLPQNPMSAPPAEFEVAC